MLACAGADGRDPAPPAAKLLAHPYEAHRQPRLTPKRPHVGYRNRLKPGPSGTQLGASLSLSYMPTCGSLMLFESLHP